MSQTTNCRKCGKVFLKVSMKSTESVCHECKTVKRNAHNFVAYDEMSKVELLRAIQDMATKNDEMEGTIKKMTVRLDVMHQEMNKFLTAERIREANIIGGAAYKMDAEMKKLYIKHNNRLLKLEKKVFDGSEANTISKK
tara:strand:+ start:932 stop:1348 length:417 start_codon:yes stop_codon:yes gene_type:complete